MNVFAETVSINCSSNSDLTVTDSTIIQEYWPRFPLVNSKFFNGDSPSQPCWLSGFDNEKTCLKDGYDVIRMWVFTKATGKQKTTKEIQNQKDWEEYRPHLLTGISVSEAQKRKKMGDTFLQGKAAKKHR